MQLTISPKCQVMDCKNDSTHNRLVCYYMGSMQMNLIVKMCTQHVAVHQYMDSSEGQLNELRDRFNLG